MSVTLWIFPPQHLSLPCSRDVQPGRAGESGSHCHQPAASAGQRDAAQRRAAKPNQKDTQVGHLAQSAPPDFQLFLTTCLSLGQAGLFSVFVSFFSSPETLWGEAAQWRPWWDRWLGWWVAEGEFLLLFIYLTLWIIFARVLPGCPLILTDMDVIEKIDSLSKAERDFICTLLFHTINWFREVIVDASQTGFID